MKLHNRTLIAAIAVASLAVLAKAEVALTTVATFDGTNGKSPLMLIETSDGGFVGTAANGGIGFNGSYGGNGVIFKVRADGTLTNLVKFEAGGYPAFILHAANQRYFGTLLSGPGNDSGALFKLNPDGEPAEFHPVSFTSTNGEYPVFLVEDKIGNLYGVTQFGGSASGFAGKGTVFKIDTNSVFSQVARFNGTNGASPVHMILGADGDFYGLTQQGGAENQGTVFRLSPDGNLNSLFSFRGTNGTYPTWLLQAKDGDFYGVTGNDGVGHGTVFKISTNGSMLWSFSFNGTNGSQPNVLMQGADGNFYGTTGFGGGAFNGSLYSGHGTVFRVSPAGDFASLVSFEGTNGHEPFFLTTGKDGRLFGTTQGGGESGLGVVFRLSVPMASVLRTPVLTRDGIALQWSAVAGQTYQLQYAPHPGSTNWSNLGDPVVATNGLMQMLDAIGPESQRFYRVLLDP